MKSLIIKTSYIENTKQTLDKVHIAYKLKYKDSKDIDIVSKNYTDELIDEEISLSVINEIEGLREEQFICNSIQEGRDLLKSISDSRRRVTSIYDLQRSYLKSDLVITSFIKFRHITEAEIENLIVRYEWPNKVFNLEGLTNLYVKSIEGNLGCINGICLTTLNNLIQKVGLNINSFIIY